MEAVRAKGISKRFGDNVAVDNVSFSVNEGIVTSLLGPSGCGKSTTLRCIAGVEVPDSGTVEIEGQVVTDIENGVFIPPYSRNVGFVFQNYALWPHMTVFDNVAFGLKMKKTPRKEIEERVTQTLRDVGLGEKIKKYPFELSGGEQQRVSLARSIVYNPRLILLDEPLSNVDARLAISMRSEVKRILHSLGIASVYVTHDQEEAFVVSDRILVMNKGKIIQEGAPSDIYERPNSEFVIDFIGRSNIFHGTLRSKGAGGGGEVDVDDLGIVLKCFPPPNIEKGMQCLVALRPNEISIKHGAPPNKENVLEGIAVERNYRGNVSDHVVRIGDKQLLITSHRFCPMAESSDTGDKVYIYIPPSAITLSPV